jgi:Tol biopolymer transport system component
MLRCCHRSIVEDMRRGVLLVVLATFAVPAAASPSATSVPIAVARASGAIELVTPAGKRVATLTAHRPWIDADPAWSPDAKQLAFTRTTNGYRSFQVYVMRADGSHVRRLTNGRFDERPAWSPDGRWIAFESVEGIRIVHPDGSGARLLPRTAENGASYPSWTRAGRIAFAWHAERRQDWPESCKQVVRMCGWVVTMTLDGRDRRAVVRGRDARWSPDGRRLVYTLPDGGVATASAAGAAPHMIGHGHQADWSPDGKQIVYTRMGADEAGDSVWIMNRDGSGKHRILAGATTAAWRPR